MSLAMSRAPEKWVVKSVQKMPPRYKGAPRPAVAFAGRSNVGKSTLINALLRRKAAPTSKAPGRTRGVHRYLINERWDLVDLPGYGFAKVNEELRRKWRGMVSDFLAGHGNLRQVLVLVDARRGLGELDAEMVQWAVDEGVGATVVLTKADKLKRGELARLERETAAALPEGIGLFTVSATKREGVQELEAALLEWFSRDAFRGGQG
jgi:GTP-binding protein